MINDEDVTQYDLLQAAYREIDRLRDDRHKLWAENDQLKQELDKAKGRIVELVFDKVLLEEDLDIFARGALDPFMSAGYYVFLDYYPYEKNLFKDEQEARKFYLESYRGKP